VPGSIGEVSAQNGTRNVPRLRRPALAGRRAVPHSTLAVVNLTAVRFLVAALTGWLNDEQEEVVAYLVEENRTCGLSCEAFASS
jgi:hypothetical protein